MSIGLTQVQANCLSFLKEYKDEKGIAPSYDEIMEHFGWTSKCSVNRILLRLEERGAIRRMPAKARAIEIVPESEQRSVVIPSHIWPLLIDYCIKERASIETAVAQFIRDGVENG